MTTNDANATGPLTWVLGNTELISVIEACRTASEVVVDLETTGLDEYAVSGGRSNGGVAARISLASFTLPQEGDDGRWDGEVPITYILPLSHPDSPWLGSWRRTIARVLREGVLETRRAVTNQNVKFDARWVYALTGVDLSDLIAWDTQVSSHLLDETQSTRLKERVPATFEGVDRWDDFDLTYPGASEDVPLIELGEYAARDTWWTWRLKQEHVQEMFLQGGGYPEPVYDLEPESSEEYLTARLGTIATWVAMPTVASLTKIEQNGFRLDIPWARAKLAEDEVAAAEALDALAQKYGMDREKASTAATSLWFKEFTRRAVDDGSLRITALTPNNNPKWSKGVLGRQSRAGYETATLILQQRNAAKRAEFLRSWLEYVRSDGRIHARYNVGRVSTGRLSSSEPNMQQVAKKLRPAFIPSDGYVLADFDFSQIELRVAAFVSRCEPMLQAFNDGLDLHRLLGQRIVADRNRGMNAKAANLQARLSAGGLVTPAERHWLESYVPVNEHPTLEEVTAAERQGAKSANFGLLYDQSAHGYREYAEDVYGVVLTEEEAVAFHAAFFDQWKGMKEWHQRVKTFVRRNGYVVSPIGRVRRLSNVWSGNSYLEGEAERQAINSPVQGFASDLMQLAAADIQGILPGSKAVPGVRLVATVHDSIVAELPVGNWLELAEEIRARMEGVGRWVKRLGVELDVPLVADYSVGTRWSWEDISNPEQAVA
jgi:DNA polymerase-1